MPNNYYHCDSADDEDEWLDLEDLIPYYGEVLARRILDRSRHVGHGKRPVILAREAVEIAKQIQEEEGDAP
jgi:hypothetical protein